MAEIVIDTYRCSGCGTCAEMCPEVFRMDNMMEKAELVTVAPQITDAVYQAAAFCPEKCIAVSP
ncbi:MAG: ferredoxin [Candidatus Electronema aureum]|uniref:Ferredoxin n=1 Tax=Candidatus Electronema aureum TaxID=2005002 RepID=A0A521G214_9BACT|nr:ferredoxin [Desulfobulbus sp. F5]TAA75060.1 MAG: ferredoxin [Candidatus Electronema aureum]